MYRKKLALLICLITGLFAQTALANQQVIVKDAWIADAPAVSRIRAAYLQLHNTGKHTIVIKKFSSPDFASIELHKTMMDNGMMKMEEVPHLSIKAGEQVEFKPGAYHLMLFTPKRKLKTGDKVKIQIRFDNNKTSPFSAEVRKRDSGMQHDHGHHQH